MKRHRTAITFLTLALILLTTAAGFAPAGEASRAAEQSRKPRASRASATRNNSGAASATIVWVKQSASPLDRGAQGLGQAINKLAVIASALHTGAHPDDEDSGLLAYLARGRQARTAYLSLTRGDGGQNLIGPELYESLGVIRTEELLAARRLDGASQFFTRAYDFGFSKSRDEALAKWDRDAVLADMVRVIRVFRPLVIVSAWTGTPSDGHGHHQAAGLLTQEAYRAAADPSRYPEQIAAGLRPWQAMKLYTRASSRRRQRNATEPEAGTLSINTGRFDPLFGKSYFEIAMQGRSQHRSQDMGAIERRGPQFSRIKLIDSSVALSKEEKDLFDGIDTSLTGIARFAGRGAATLKLKLAEAQKIAEEARRIYNPLSHASLTPVLAIGLAKIKEIRASLPRYGLDQSQLYDTDFLLRQKEQDFADALAKAEGLVIDCLANDEVVVPGQSFDLSVSAYANTAPVSVSLSVPEGWSSVQQKQSSAVTDGRLASQTDFKVTIARDADFTQPYWLTNPRRGDMFAPGKSGTGIEPQSPPPAQAVVEFDIAGQKIALTQPAQYRFANKALGEIRRELKVAPAVSVSVSPAILISPARAAGLHHEVTVSLLNNSNEALSGRLKLEAPANWKVTPEEASFEFKRAGERAAFTFAVAVPPGAAEGQYALDAIASTNDHQYRSGYQALDYPHIEPRFVYHSAEAIDKVFDVQVAPGLKVGFIEGAGDYFAGALAQLGVDVKLLDSRDIASGNLDGFDVIVTGIRAYEVRADLVANNQRLLDYVRRGGTLIVQYNKNEYVTGNFAPYPVKMVEPPSDDGNDDPNSLKYVPDRVTDERATVTLLEPGHPLFNFPNKITERDFDGWTQERGAYFLREWDARFKPLLASHDSGEGMKQGGELIAEYGRGLYVYTAYAWFRQLPEGVPGAYRLIANLVSLPKAKSHTDSR